MTDPRFPNVRIHPTALIEEGVQIGEGSVIWDNVHIRRGTRIGKKCIVGEKTYIAYAVQIGNLVKLNAGVYICTAVTIEDGVMISAHTVFTNDKFPRAILPDFSDLMPSEPTDETLQTIVRRGVTIGANATIGPGIELGEFAMIGMGSVVTRSIPAYALAFGSPARVHGYVSACGYPLGNTDLLSVKEVVHCKRCGKGYRLINGILSPLPS
ncbi:MAG TPA: acyltransferase [Candidatus Limnocylindrales bacterium]|nr:acyltransferase [Candidatus Limnocylindrales bacterium]